MKQDTSIKLIEYDSQEFQQACQLRYELFFAEHSLPWNVVQDRRQANYFHAAVLKQKSVVAYAQLVPQDNGIYQICQMVVKPYYQKQNYGSRMLLFLIEKAKQEGAIALSLNARLTAADFYQKFGFQTQGKEFPSGTTGVPHITMNKQLRDDKQVDRLIRR